MHGGDSNGNLTKMLHPPTKTRACNNFDNLSVFIFVKFTNVLEMKETSGDVLPSGKVSKVP